MSSRAKKPKGAKKISASGRPTIVDVAHAAGVSSATVSNTMTGRRYVDGDTRERVLKAARRLGYTPNLRARRLRTGLADTIAIFSPMPFAVAAGPSRLGFLMEIAASAATAALESGIALILVPPLERGRPPFSELHIDGAIVVEPASNDADILTLRDRGIPVVAIGRCPGSEDLPFIDLHSFETARLMLDHLADQSCKKIALMIGDTPRNSYMETEAAYRQFAEERGMDPLVVCLDEAGGEDLAREETRNILRAHPDLDGLCVPVDAFATGAVKAATDLRLGIPYDLKVATRYDGPRARETQPPLTAVDLKLDRVANLAVELLIEHINKKEPRPLIEGPLPKLIARGSTMAEDAKTR